MYKYISYCSLPSLRLSHPCTSLSLSPTFVKQDTASSITVTHQISGISEDYKDRQSSEIAPLFYRKFRFGATTVHLRLPDYSYLFIRRNFFSLRSFIRWMDRSIRLPRLKERTAWKHPVNLSYFRKLKSIDMCFRPCFLHASAISVYAVVAH